MSTISRLAWNTLWFCANSDLGFFGQPSLFTVRDMRHMFRRNNLLTLPLYACNIGLDCQQLEMCDAYYVVGEKETNDNELSLHNLVIEICKNIYCSNLSKFNLLTITDNIDEVCDVKTSGLLFVVNLDEITDYMSLCSSVVDLSNSDKLWFLMYGTKVDEILIPGSIVETKSDEKGDYVETANGRKGYWNLYDESR